MAFDSHKRNHTTMRLSNSIRRLNSACGALRRRLIKDRRGIAAVEFALIVPLLLVMYFVTMEAGQGIDTNKKLGRLASMVADLVTQESSVNKADLDAILQIGAAIIQPYNRSKPSIYIAGIQFNGANPPVATVVWRRSIVNGTAGSATPSPQPTIPTSVRIANTFLVQVHTTLAYKPVITWAASNKDKQGFTSPFNSIPMGETYYLRARNGPTVTCVDC